MRRRRVLTRVLAATGAVVVVAAVGGYWYERPLLLTGTGYAAHNACAVSGIAGRTDPVADLPPNPLVPYLRTSGDPRSADSGNSSRSTILGALAGQTAWYTPGFGCTIGTGRPDLGTATSIPAGANPFTSATVAAPRAEIEAAIDTAFGTDLDAKGRSALGTRGIVIVKDGTIVGERYAPEFTSTTPQLGWSMSKSVTNLMVGRLVAQGKVAVTDSHLRPEWTDQRSTITIDDLMRMTSGLAWDETYDLGTPITRMLYLEPDMAGYVAGQPLAHPVGSYQQYSSGSTTALCGILEQRAGGGADLVRREILAPLGMSSAVWEADSVGTTVCSSYLWATPRDWAAVGSFALAGGVWNGVRLLPDGWMRTSTTVTPLPAGGHSDEVGYAAGWWVNRLADGSLADPKLPADAYWADGHDGQRLYVVPSANLVVVRLGFSPGVTDDALRANDLVRTMVALPGR